MRFQAIDPFRDLDRIFRTTARPVARVDYDVIRYEDHLELIFDLPGFDPDSIDLSVDGRELVLTATRTNDVPEGATVVVAGRPEGEITRRLHMSDVIDTAGLSASYDHGLLRVTLPLVPEASPRRISIGSGTTEQ